MTDIAIAKLREQQAKAKERSPQWMVAEQLIDICRNEPKSAELIAKDLENEKMAIVEAEKQIKALADERHRKNRGGSVAVSPMEAEKALRKFYGLPERGAAPEPAGGVTFNFEDFLR